jgi:myo-inositol-1(or 4)-monophosphatase
MSPAELDLRQYAVLGLVTEVSRMALDYFRRRESLGVTMKGAQDWLTVADGALENYLRQRLAVLFPGDAVIGEEGGGQASDAVWIIDPIEMHQLRSPPRPSTRSISGGAGRAPR